MADFERALGSADSQDSTESTTEEVTGTAMFIHHKLSKLDTLAGLAVKYNVSVGDIKRANGLLSDSALYARGTILIPTGALPIMHELQNLCAQVLSGVSRDPVLHAETQLHPASAAVARIATSLNVVNGQSYPEDLPISDLAWMAMCQCGPTDPSGHGHKHLNQQPQEVEMTDRSSEGTYYLPPAHGSTRQGEAVRRRAGRNPGDDMDCTDSANSAGGGWLSGGSGRQHRAQGQDRVPGRFSMGRAASGDGGSENGSLSAWISGLGKAIGDGVSQTVAKVKEAANQPVLAAGSGGSGFGAAADGIIASRRRVPGSATLGRAPFQGDVGSAAAGYGGYGVVHSVRTGKQGGKDD